MRNGRPTPTVSGPGLEPRPAPTLNAAISLAQTKASRYEGDSATFYVYDENERIRYHVEKLADGVIVTREAVTS